VERAVRQAGLQQVLFLGLTAEDWINLFISLLFVLLGGFLGSRLVFYGLQLLVRTTPGQRDDTFLPMVQPQVYALVWTVSLQIATQRLEFLDPGVKQLLDQVYFVVYVLIFFRLLWRLIDEALAWYLAARQAAGSPSAEAAVVLVGRVLRFFLLSIALIVILENIGVNVAALLAALGLGGLALSLGAQDTLTNMISGSIILMDQPFRVGDRIEIQGLDTWGDVIEIGLRSTRIRTLDNRMVIIPNASISTTQVVNYTYPDPQYREQVEISVAYSSDLPQVRELLAQAVSHVEGVLDDKPVDVLFVKFGDSSLIVRVRWWITSYLDSQRVSDRVNSVILETLVAAGVDMPNPAMDIFLQQPGEANHFPV
jgi:small-conductance mechanosensitive channel